MQEQNRQEKRSATTGRKGAPPPTFVERVAVLALRIWRPAGSVLAVALAGMLMWHVVSGKHGLSVWQQKRTQDKQLRQEIDGLEQENARLRERVQKLKTDPHAIEREARERLHYAKPGEVIYSLPPDPPSPNPHANK
jgi:cell division protein FtsB